MILQVPGLSSQLGSKLHTLPETNIPLMVHKSCSPVDMEKSLIIYRVFITRQVVFFPDSFHQQQVRTWKWMVGWNTICKFLLGESIFFRGELATLVSGECNLQLFDFVIFFVCFFFQVLPIYQRGRSSKTLRLRLQDLTWGPWSKPWFFLRCI